MKVKCTRNTSSSLPYFVGVTYHAEELPGGMYKIKVPNGRHIIAPLNGYYLNFIKI